MVTARFPTIDESRLASEVAHLPLLREVPGAGPLAFASLAARQVTDAFWRGGSSAAVEHAWQTGWRAGERCGQYDAAEHITRTATDAAWRDGTEPDTRTVLGDLAQQAGRWRGAAGSEQAHPDLQAPSIKVPTHELVRVLAAFAHRHADQLHLAAGRALLHGAVVGRYAAALKTLWRLSSQTRSQARAGGIDLSRVRIAGRPGLEWLASPSRAGLQFTDLLGEAPLTADSPSATSSPLTAHQAGRPQPRTGSGPPAPTPPTPGSAPVRATSRPAPSPQPPHTHRRMQ